MQGSIHALASLRADPDVFGKRGLPPKVVVKHPDFWDQYDNDTLIYDAIWCPRQGKIDIFLPKLISFEDRVRQAKWRIDGRLIKPRRLRHYRVYDVLSLPCEHFEESLSFTLGDFEQVVPVSQADHDRFAGRRVLYTQVKDDPLPWVRDWLAAHQRNHGADAVLVSNNGSTQYSSAELQATLASVEGIAVADVLDVPLRYGPIPRMASNVGMTKFQQRTLLNVVKTRWFASAYGVLLCDLDELVAARDGHSIFEATRNSWLKYTRFDGEWRYYGDDISDVRHADHIFRRDNGKRCASKYCVVPDSILGRQSWSVHALESVNRRLFPASKKFVHYHCRGISTSWKNARGSLPESALQRDERTVSFMKQTFPVKAPDSGQ